KVTLIVRAPTLEFHNPPQRRTLYRRIRAPYTTLGPGYKNFICTQGPLIFHRMPEDFRIRVVDKHLGPAAGWFTRAQFTSEIETLVNTSVVSAVAKPSAVHLRVARDNAHIDLEVDHVIAATGYRVDTRKLEFLSDELNRSIQVTRLAPKLSTSF